MKKTGTVIIESLNSNTLSVLAGMMHLLWPDCSEEEALREGESILISDHQQAFLAKEGNQYTGFVQVSLRNEFVEGATGSPVAYIEGIFVHAAYRMLGIGKELTGKAEEWAVEQGCAEIASDAELENKSSIAFHKKAGFREVNRIVCYIKKVK
jgi:aminoglycoside 6'-N-acetyltransferase I